MDGVCVCRHRYIWAVALYITEASFFFFTGGSQEEIITQIQLARRCVISRVFRRRQSVFLTKHYESLHSQRPPKYSQSSAAPLPGALRDMAFP